MWAVGLPWDHHGWNRCGLRMSVRCACCRVLWHIDTLEGSMTWLAFGSGEGI
jgi:hypothetical protein